MISESLLKKGFVYEGEIVDANGCSLHKGPPTKNVLPQGYLDHLAALVLGTGLPISSWYVGLFEGDFAPGRSTKAADLQINAQECQAYSQSARPAWNAEYDESSLLSNLLSRAEFSMTADKRIFGAFLVSSATKGGTDGLLMSIARFGSPYDVPAGTTFRLGASLNLIAVD